MPNHLQFTDLDFEQQFRNCKLDPSDFTHEAHLRLAWINIEMYGIDTAITNIQDQLERFVASVGAKDKYNKTLTIAAIKTVYHFKLKSKATSFKDFIAEFPRLNYAFKDLIASHYSIDIYNSPLAKMEYIAPDLMAYD